MKNPLIIVIEGGIIQNIHTNAEVEILIIDHDSEILMSEGAYKLNLSKASKVPESFGDDEWSDYQTIKNDQYPAATLAKWSIDCQEQE